MDDKRVSLEKKIEKEAPVIANLAKKASVSLQKANLGGHRAKVALCLDISGSMSALYSSGKIQSLSEKVLALGTRFDDDGAIDIFLFGINAHTMGEMGIENFSNFTAQMLKKRPLEGGTNYGKVVQMIRRHYFPEGKGEERTSPIASDLPVYVMFVTDGATNDEALTESQIRAASFEPIFWQFMAIGKSSKDVKAKKGFFGKLFGGPSSEFAFLERLDTMQGRFVDNANFFSIEDPATIPDEELYDLLMAEYPGWVKLAKEKGLLR